MRKRTPPFTRLQELPSGAARFCLSLERFCRTELAVDLMGQSLVIAYSGGADSRALLTALRYLAPRLDLTLHAATLDHALRPESALEVEDASALCSSLGIRFHTVRLDAAAHARKNGIGLEEAGRLLRLDFLETVRRKTHSAWIATGHQLDDLAEDSLMRMLRGTGWPALAGMAGRVDDARIIRPLLLTPRVSIEAFLAQLGESWHVDATNSDDAYLRNRIRRHILPLLLEENPGFLETVADRWRMARQDETLFANALALVPAEERENGIFLARENLLPLTPSLRLRKYREILAGLGRGQARADQMRALDAAWLRNEGGREIRFPGGKRAHIWNGGVLFCMKNAS